MNITEDTRDLAAYLATLTAIVMLSKIGGTGADLAIMTGLVGVLGMLVGRKGRTSDQKAPDEEPKP
jgi:hypothetical protein